MAAAPRIFAFAVCAVTVAGCNRFTEAKLFGTWRSEDADVVDEIACRADHTFTSWASFKNELTTPSVLIEVGTWRVQGHQLIVHCTKSVHVDSFVNNDEQITFPLVRVSKDALQMKNFDGSKVLTYKRLSHDYALDPIKRAPIDADFVGSWQIHYNTHDCEIAFNKDHSYSLFVAVNASWEQFFTGSWHTSGNRIVIDRKSVPQYPGESVEESQLRWTVTGIDSQKLAIKDGPVPYILERLR